MVIPAGTLINAGVILVGCLVGMILGQRLPERVKEIVFQGLGLCIAVLGMHMTLKTSNILYLIISIALGGIIGELARIEDRIIGSGEKLKKAIRSGNARFTEGFLTSTLFFCAGALSIVGPMQEGLSGDMSTLMAKSIIDGFGALALGAAFGSGVFFAVIPLVIYQGSITLFSDVLRPYFSEQMYNELEGVGGVLILAIGLNTMKVSQIRVSNFIPALLVVILLCLAAPALQKLVSFQ